MRRALIAGAGNAGLFLALLLRRQGWEVRVLERAPQLREEGGAIVLWSNATILLKNAGLFDRLREENSEIGRIEIRRWDGHLLLGLPLATLAEQVGAPSLVVWRGSLIRALADALGRDCICLNQPLPPFVVGEEKVEVAGEGSWDLLVGADGLRSGVRSFLHGEEPVRDLGVSAWVGVSAGGWGPANTAIPTLGRGQRFLRMNMGPRTYWYAILDDKRIRPETRFPELRSLFRGWDPILNEILDHADPSQIVRFSLADRPPTLGWSRGPVTLVGDAAHPSTPDLGQGTCQAIESAWVLAGALNASSTIFDALSAYERQRRVRTAAITTLSYLSLLTTMPMDRLRSVAASIGIAHSPKSIAEELLRWQFVDGPRG